jgi:hypothetical protein
MNRALQTDFKLKSCIEERGVLLRFVSLGRPQQGYPKKAGRLSHRVGYGFETTALAVETENEKRGEEKRNGKQII